MLKMGVYGGLAPLLYLLYCLAVGTEAISSEEEYAVDTQWLSDLQFRTRTGLDVDINLPWTMDSEKCELTKPDGTTVDVGDEIAGVTAHTSTHYVSCRVVVGPMDASLLGNWTLCGSYEEDNVKHRLCQNAEIIWRSTLNPDSSWQTTTNARFNHVVNFRGTLTPAVRGFGSVVSCHLVTPNDEDLVVTRDREYPDIKLAQETDSICSIAIGPIAERHLANWTVYGTFDSSLWGYNEVRQPINMDLYSKIHPYDQAYNVTTLNPTQHVANLGSTVFLEVAGTGVVDVCQFTMPSGESYWSTGSMPTGANFVSLNRVACRLSIGPITANMIGDWRLIGRFSNRDVHTENRLSFTIIEEATKQTTSAMTPEIDPQFVYNPDPNSQKEQEDSKKLKVETSGSSSPQEVHFALSLVPLLHAQPPRVRLDAEGDILTYLKQRLADN